MKPSFLLLGFLTTLLVLACSLKVSGQTPSTWQCQGQVRLTQAKGNFSSNLGPGAYVRNQTCSWLADDIPQGAVLSFRLLHLDTEFGYDFLTAFQGTPSSPTENGAYIQFTGDSPPPGRAIWTIAGPRVAFTWSSDWELQGTGFTVEYSISNCGGTCSQNGACWDGQCLCDDGWQGADCSLRTCAQGCGAGACDTATNTCSCPIGYYGPRCQTDYCSGVSTWVSDSGSFSDHRGAGSYLPNALCVWDIRAASAESTDALRLDFLLFDLELGLDVLEVWNGDPQQAGAQLIGEYSGTQAPSIVSLTAHLWLRFTSNGALQRSGFTASFTAISCPNSCSGHGACQHQDMCHCYPGFEGDDCSRQVCANNCSRHGQCTLDMYCECDTGYSGVDCNVCTSEAGLACPPRCQSTKTYTTATGTISSGASSYQPGDHCRFVIAPTGLPPFDSIVLTFTSFDLSLDRRARVIVALPDASPAENGGDLVIAEYAGTINDVPPPAVTAKTSSAIAVVFEVDAEARPQHGFTASWAVYRCANSCSGHGGCTEAGCMCEPGYAGDDCSTTQCVNNCSGHGHCSAQLGACVCDMGWYGVGCMTTHCSGLTTREASTGTLADHNRLLAQTYAPNSDCHYQVVTPGPGVLYVTDLQTEVLVDFLTVTDASSPPSFSTQLSGSLLPYPIVFNSRGFNVAFSSDAQNNFLGFELQWNSFSNCPGSCSGHGLCLMSNVCACAAGFFGDSCENFPLDLTPLSSNSSLPSESVELYNWNYYAVDVQASSSSSSEDGKRDSIDVMTTDTLYIHVTSNGATYQLPTLFVRYQYFPTTQSFDYREALNQWSNEHVVKIQSPSAGRWYIGIFGVATQGYSLKLSTTKPQLGPGGHQESSAERDGGFALTVLIIAIGGLVIIASLCIVAIIWLVRKRAKQSEVSRYPVADPMSFYTASEASSSAQPKKMKRPKRAGYERQLDEVDPNQFE